MIPNHKWVKPENYRGDLKCWIAKKGIVYIAIFDKEKRRLFFIIKNAGFTYWAHSDIENFDGVCERKDGEKKPELR